MHLEVNINNASVPLPDGRRNIKSKKSSFSKMLLKKKRPSKRMTAKRVKSKPLMPFIVTNRKRVPVKAKKMYSAPNAQTE